MVTLKGEARAPADPLLAERLVRETPGVRGVELELVVKPAPHADHRQDHQDEWVDKSSLLYPILPT